MNSRDYTIRMDLKAQLRSLIEKIADPETSETDRGIFIDTVVETIEDLVIEIVNSNR